MLLLLQPLWIQIIFDGEDLHTVWSPIMAPESILTKLLVIAENFRDNNKFLILFLAPEKLDLTHQQDQNHLQQLHQQQGQHCWIECTSLVQWLPYLIHKELEVDHRHNNKAAGPSLLQQPSLFFSLRIFTRCSRARWLLQHVFLIFTPVLICKGNTQWGFLKIRIGSIMMS